MRSPRTLRGRLAMWSCIATLLGLVVFAVAAYVVFAIDEREEAESGVPDDPADVDAEAREHVLVALAIAAPIATGMSVLAALWAARRATSPVRRAIADATTISVDRFDRRMDVPDEEHELRPLAVAINELLDRLQRGYLALSEFSGAASHELRTPLATMCNELEVALRRPRPVDEWEASSRVVLDELRRLAGVVDAMLQFAQADTIRDADATEVDLLELADEVASLYSGAARARDVTIAIDGPPELQIRAHPDLLATAIGNIVGNAVRLTRPGGTVTITASGTGRLDIDDDGPGLPADRAGLFVPFSKLARTGRGIGLGLAITKRIVERHGGAISATDRLTGGARFTIVL